MDLRKLLGLHVAPPKHGVLGNNTPEAKQYFQNPRATNVDPAQFGYAPDNSGSPLHVQPGHFAANLGVPTGNLPQGNGFNPGFIPLQGSQGAQAYPQMHANGGVQRPGDQFNPQNNRRQQYWQ